MDVNIQCMPHKRIPISRNADFSFSSKTHQIITKTDKLLLYGQLNEV